MGINIDMNQSRRNQGFTLIELILAMTFISILLVAITLMIIQISTIYNRGLTVKEVNVAGRSIGTELQRSIKSSSLFTIQAGPNNRYIQQGTGLNAWGGRLCLGEYSYIWNYGQALANPVTSGNSLNVYSTNPSATLIRFVKVKDSGATYCTTPTKAIIKADAVELLNVGDHNLAVHAFSITSEATAVDNKAKQQLYTISYTIGTNALAALAPDRLSCLGPGSLNSDLSYCVVQGFDIVARAGN